MAIVSFNDQNSNKKYEIFKRLTIIGSSVDADIKLSSTKISSVAAYISKTDDNFTLIVPSDKEAAIIDKKFVRKAELKNGQKFSIADCEFAFNEELFQNKNENKDINKTLVVAHKKLLEFSQKIAKEKNIKNLLETLLSEITLLTNAEHGFLVLIENNKPKIHAQKNIISDEISSISPISDSIVNKVIKTKEAIVISNALDDKEFSSSMSVINYRLTSVMCVPLCYQNEVFGAIYVGNNSFVNVFDEKSLSLMTIYSSQAALLVQNALYIDALEKDTNKLKESLDHFRFGSMIGSCQGMQNVFSKIEKISHTDISVLIIGENGTGKELVAREIHERSSRSSFPLITINCSAVSEDILESELFGHVRGAFEGALQTRMGKLQLANKGTILLNELDAIPLDLQVKLLKALEEQKVTRMGDLKSEPIDIRVLATTSLDLLTLIKKSLFREDLYYKLNNVEIEVPPLKDRGNDVFVMANFFLQKYAQVYGKNIVGFYEEAQNTLIHYSWPGNVRELENSIKRAVVLCDERKISSKDMDINVNENDTMPKLCDAIEKFKIKYINDSLERNAGNRTKTAKELGVDPRTIFRHLESQKRDDY